MTRDGLIRWLQDHDACSESIAWVQWQDTDDMQVLWDRCDDWDWILWVLKKARCDLRALLSDALRPGRADMRLADLAREHFPNPPELPA